LWLLANTWTFPFMAADLNDQASPKFDLPLPITLSTVSPDRAIRNISVRENVQPDLSVEQIDANVASDFKPFVPGKIYDTDRNHVIWLHFQILAEQSITPAGWTLEFTKTYIDRIDFYRRDQYGDWQRQSAGLDVAHVEWSKKGLWPQFDLPVLQPGVNDFYVRLLEQAPFVPPIRFQPTERAQMDAQSAFLSSGLMLALLMVMAILGSMLAFGYRDSTYAWYSLYATLSFCAAAGLLGVAKHVFLPNWLAWPGWANLVLAMAAVTAQLQFCRAMFLHVAPSRRWNVSVSAIIFLASGFMALCIGLKNYPPVQTALVAISVVVCISQMLVLVTRAFQQEQRIATLWLLAYFPLSLTLILTLLNTLTSIVFSWLPENMIVYGLVFEVPVLLIALHVHAKAQHARQVYGSVLAAIDPLTGFVPPRRFEATLATCWKSAQRKKRDLAVAYIEVSQTADGSGAAPVPALSHPKTTARIVRMLRTAALEHDTVARINPRVFALLMPGMAPGELLASRLARLVALSLMADGEEPHGAALRLRIVASTRRTFAGSWKELHKALQHKLRSSEGWTHRTIRFARQAPLPPPDTLDTLWERATQKAGLVTLK
jgi:two-component system, sensor histidine kinase LadS